MDGTKFSVEVVLVSEIKFIKMYAYLSLLHKPLKNGLYSHPNCLLLKMMDDIILEFNSCII